MARLPSPPTATSASRWWRPMVSSTCRERILAVTPRLATADGEDGNGCEAHHALGHAAHEEAPQGRAAMGANHDQVGPLAARPAEDVLGGRATGQPRLGAHAFTPRAGEQRLEPTLGLPASAGLELQITGREIDVTGEKRRGRQEDMKNEQPRSLRASATASLKAAPEAREKSVAWKIRRSRFITAARPGRPQAPAPRAR